MQNQLQTQSAGGAPAVIGQAIKEYTKKHNIPEEGLTILGGKPYINYTGLIFKAKSLGLKSIKVEILKEATTADLSAKVKAIIILKDGSEYEDFGFGSIASIKMSTLHSADFINMTTITRAKNRALRSATGVGLTSAEEMEGQPTCHNTGQDNASKLLNKDKKSEPKKAIESEVVESEQEKAKKITIDGGAMLYTAIAECGSNINDVIKFYKVESIYDLTEDQALDLSKKLKAKQDAKNKIETKKIEKQDDNIISTPAPVKTKESRAAQSMRAGKEKVKQELATKKIPANVCKYLNAIEKIDEITLPNDILALKLDCQKSNFKGEKAYPSLKTEMEKYIGK